MNYTKDACGICSRIDAEIYPVTGDFLHAACQSCGDYKISGTAVALWNLIYNRAEGDQKIALLQGDIHDKNRSGTTPQIYIGDLQSTLSRQLPTMAERSDRIILEALSTNDARDAQFNYDDPSFMPVSYSKSMSELSYLTKYMTDCALIETASSNKFTVSAKGRARHDELTSISNDNTLM